MKKRAQSTSYSSAKPWAEAVEDHRVDTATPPPEHPGLSLHLTLPTRSVVILLPNPAAATSQTEDLSRISCIGVKVHTLLPSSLPFRPQKLMLKVEKKQKESPASPPPPRVSVKATEEWSRAREGRGERKCDGSYSKTSSHWFNYHLLLNGCEQAA